MIKKYVSESIDIHVVWNVMRVNLSSRRVPEDFGTSKVYLWLTKGIDMTPLTVTVDGGKLKFDLPSGLTVGMYGVKAVWEKTLPDGAVDDGVLAENGPNEIYPPVPHVKPRMHKAPKPACPTRSVTSIVDMILVTNDEDDKLNKDEITVGMYSDVASYGYDGADSYELAVMMGKTTLSKSAWVTNIATLETQFQNTEGTANSQPNDGTRWGKFNANEGTSSQQASATGSRWQRFLSAIGLSTDTASATGSMWARFKYSLGQWGSEFVTALGESSDTPRSNGSMWARFLYGVGQSTDTASATGSMWARFLNWIGQATDSASATGSMWARFWWQIGTAADKEPGKSTMWAKYNTAETARDTNYNTAETARDTLYEAAEAERDEAMQDALSTELVNVSDWVTATSIGGGKYMSGAIDVKKDTEIDVYDYPDGYSGKISLAKIVNGSIAGFINDDSWTADADCKIAVCALGYDATNTGYDVTGKIKTILLVSRLDLAEEKFLETTEKQQSVIDETAEKVEKEVDNLLHVMTSQVSPGDLSVDSQAKVIASGTNKLYGPMYLVKGDKVTIVSQSATSRKILYKCPNSKLAVGDQLTSVAADGGSEVLPVTLSSLGVDSPYGTSTPELKTNGTKKVTEPFSLVRGESIQVKSQNNSPVYIMMCNNTLVAGQTVYVVASSDDGTASYVCTSGATLCCCALDGLCPTVTKTTQQSGDTVMYTAAEDGWFCWQDYSNLGSQVKLHTENNVVDRGLYALRAAIDVDTENMATKTYVAGLVGSLSDLTTTAKTNIVAAINELKSLISGKASMSEVNSLVGSLSSLATTVKTNIVAAINELKSDLTSVGLKVGNLENLQTTAKDNIVDALNEVNEKAGQGGGGSVAQIQSDWTQTDTTKKDYIKNKPTLASVATSGNYNDLQNKPTIPSTDGLETSAHASATYQPKGNYITDISGKVDTANVVTDSESTSYSVAVDNSQKGEKVYKLGTLTNLAITSVGASDYETIIFFSAGASGCEVAITAPYDLVGEIDTSAEGEYVISILNGCVVCGTITNVAE